MAAVGGRRVLGGCAVGAAQAQVVTAAGVIGAQWTRLAGLNLAVPVVTRRTARCQHRCTCGK